MLRRVNSHVRSRSGMNSLDRKLMRLIRAAGSARRELPSAVPARLTENALSVLRAGREDDDGDRASELRTVLRCGLLCACLAALAAFLFGVVDNDSVLN